MILVASIILSENKFFNVSEISQVSIDRQMESQNFK